MSKYQLVLSRKIIGYDNTTNKLLLYKPIEIKPTQLTDEELTILLQFISAHPEGGQFIEKAAVSND